MENPTVNKTYDCARFCKIRCSDFTLNSPLNRECLEAIDHCKCRPIWKDPAFWLIGGAIFAVFVTIGRLIYMYFKDRRVKNSHALNIGQGRTPTATISTVKEARESEPAGAKTCLPAAKTIVVESSVAEKSP